MSEALSHQPSPDPQAEVLAPPLPAWQAPVWLFALASGLGAAGALGLAAVDGLAGIVALDPGATLRLAWPALVAATALGIAGWHRLDRPEIEPLYLFAWLSLGGGLIVGLAPKIVLAAAFGAFWAAPAVLLGAACVAGALMAAALPLGRAAFGAHLGSLGGFLRTAGLGLGAGAATVTGQLLGRVSSPVAPDALAYLAAFVLVVVGVASLHLSKQSWEAPAAPEPSEPQPHLRWASLGAALALGLAVPAQLRILQVVAGSEPRVGLMAGLVLALSVTVGCLAGAAWRHQGALVRQVAVPALAGLGLAATTLLHDKLALRFVGLESALAPDQAGHALLAWGQAGLALLLLAPGAVGLTLVLALAAEDEGGARLAPRFARLLGAAALGLGLAASSLPLALALHLAACLCWVQAALAAGQLLAWPRLRRLLALGAPVLVAVAALLLARQHDWHALTAPRGAEPPASWGDLRLAGEDRRVLAHADDGLVSVTAFETPDAPELAVNGVPSRLDASALVRGRLAGHLPMLLMPTGQRVAQLGFGDGTSVGALLAQPILALELVEPSSALLREVGPQLASRSGWQPEARLRSHVAAPLPWLRTSREPLDLILLTAPLRGNAPVGARPSVELFEAMAQRLSPSGQVAVEFDLGQHDDVTLGRSVRTLRRVFPHVSLWQTADDHLLAIGRLAPAPVSLEAMRDRLAVPSVKAQLAPLGLDRPAPLLMLQMHTAESIEAISRDPAVERVARPQLPGAQAVAAFGREGARGAYKTDSRLRTGGAADPQLALLRLMRQGRLSLTPQDFRAFIVHSARHLPLNQVKHLDAQVIREWRRSWPRDPVAALADAERLAQSGDYTAALAALQSGPEASAAKPGFEAALRFSDAVAGWGWLTRRPPQLPAALAAWRRAIPPEARQAGDAWVRIAAMHHAEGDWRAEFEAGEKALGLLERVPGPGASDTRLRLLVALSRTAYWLGDERRFRLYTRAAAATDPADVELQELVRLASQAFPPAEVGP